MNNVLIINGQVNTMNPLQPFAEAVAIVNGRIAAVGTNEEAKAASVLGSEIIDAGGNSVFPGFIDTHVHFMMTGQDAAAVNLNNVLSQKEFFDTLKEAEKDLKPGRWLLGTGYDETQFPEKKMPSIEELDAAFPDRPIFIGRIDAHQVCLNSMAFRMLNIPLDSQGVLLNEKGEFSGIIVDPSNGLARTILSDNLITDEMRKEYLFIAAQEALKEGTTTLCALEGGTLCNEKDVPVFLEYQDKLPIHTRMLHQVLDVPKVISEGQKSIGGCITLDGSMGSRTAAFMEDYCDMPGEKGNLYYTPKEIEEFVMEAHSKGLQIAMHCIGDHAIEVLLQAYEKALYKYPRPDHRHRFEHFSVPTYNQIIRAKNLGCYIAVQPSYLFNPAGANMVKARLGEERSRRAYCFKTLMNAGIVLGGGSDASVTPINPFRGIVAGMNQFNVAERFTLYEGLKMMTADAALFTFEEKEKGTLEVGKLGDVAIIEGNIWEMDTTDYQAMNDIKFLYTIVAGNIAYRG